jgi:hypothetical protein
MNRKTLSISIVDARRQEKDLQSIKLNNDQELQTPKRKELSP